MSALAPHLGVDWHTLWDAIEREASARLADPPQLDGVTVLGLVLGLVPGRTGTAYATWLKAQPEEFTAGITEASLDVPYSSTGYANAPELVLGGLEHVHARGVEQGVRAGTPAHPRTTRKVIHVEVFS